MTKQKEITISVIIPVFNAEQYLPKCIDSLQQQSFDNLEFLFIDDCSTDGSYALLQECAKKDSRISVFQNARNLGAGKTRNVGIDIAKGQYLSFLDADDYIAQDFYKLLYEKAQSESFDIVKGTLNAIDKNGNPQKWPNLNRMFHDENKKHLPLYCKFTYEHVTAIFKRELFQNNQIRYGEKLAGEDNILLLKLCLNNPSFALEENAIYYHIIHSSSLEQRGGLQQWLDTLEGLEERIRILKTRGIIDSDYFLINKMFNYLFDLIKREYPTFDEIDFQSTDFQCLAKRIKEILQQIPKYSSIIQHNPRLQTFLKKTNQL